MISLILIPVVLCSLYCQSSATNYCKNQAIKIDQHAPPDLILDYHLCKVTPLVYPDDIDPEPSYNYCSPLIYYDDCGPMRMRAIFLSGGCARIFHQAYNTRTMDIAESDNFGYLTDADFYTFRGSVNSLSNFEITSGVTHPLRNYYRGLLVPDIFRYAYDFLYCTVYVDEYFLVYRTDETNSWYTLYYVLHIIYLVQIDAIIKNRNFEPSCVIVNWAYFSTKALAENKLEDAEFLKFVDETLSNLGINNMVDVELEFDFNVDYEEIGLMNRKKESECTTPAITPPSSPLAKTGGY